MSQNFLLNTELTDYSVFTNFLFIDDHVTDREIFYNNVNSNTFPIQFYSVYNINNLDFISKELPNTITDTATKEKLTEKFKDIHNIENKITQKQELLNFVRSKNFTNLKRLSIVANNSHINDIKPFLDSDGYFSFNDFTNDNYSTNLLYLIDFINEFNIKHIDFLMCNALKNENWIKYFEILKKETGVIVGASNDETGNINYGGDWLLESTNEDIKNTYFTNGIESYSKTLVATTITENTTINQINVNNYTWPVTITGSITITIGLDLTLSGNDKYFIFVSSEILFDGNNKTITIQNANNYPGLIQNGGVSDGYSNTMIQNINMNTNNSTLADYAGWIAQQYYSYGANNNTINNCTSIGEISGNYAGGIAGSFAGFNAGSCTISNCSSNSLISGNYAGSIAGGYAGISGSCTISNCSSRGIIFGNYAGGIAGGYAGISGSCTISHCSSSRSISGLYAGGIAGVYAGSNSGSCTISNCNSSGSIFGNYTGGIAGSYAGNAGSCTINNCYSRGAISGSWSGGIAGYRFGSSSQYTSFITKCFSLNIIRGEQSGGIVGAEVGYLNTNLVEGVIIENCYSRGTLFNENATGGICGGSQLISYTAIIKLINCYSLYSPFVSPTLQITPNITITNCYDASGFWSTTDAIFYLITNTTPNYNTNPINPIGSVWATTGYNISDNIPFIFSNFGNSPYVNPTANVLPGETTQSAVITTGYTYSIIAISNSPPAPPFTYPFITINSLTGAITVLSSGKSGNYILYVYALDRLGGYSVTTFNLTISGGGNQIIPLTTNLAIFYSKKERKKIEKRIRKYINDL